MNVIGLGGNKLISLNLQLTFLLPKGFMKFPQGIGCVSVAFNHRAVSLVHISPINGPGVARVKESRIQFRPQPRSGVNSIAI